MASKPIPTTPIPNPLHEYASYTYTWSLWWLDKNDANALSGKTDAGSAITYPLSMKSYVLAEDAGLYPDRRLPSTYGLNYYIQDVRFTTVIGLNKNSKSSNAIDGDFTVIEPYGVTLVDALIEHSADSGTTYTSNPYMLELNFTGYDDNGIAIRRSEAHLFRKRFPIKLLDCKISVSGKGAEYKFRFVPTGGGEAHSEELRTLPKAVSVTAGTVNEFFNGNAKADPAIRGLAGDINDFWTAEAKKGDRQVADVIKFEFDSEIGNSKITSKELTSLASSNPNTKKLDLTKNSFNIPKGSTYLDILDKVMAQSDWLVNKQLELEKNDKSSAGDTAPPAKSQTTVFNAFKTLTSVKYLDFDKQRGTFGKEITYKIHQYPTWNTNHPDLPQLADSKPYTSKVYNYLYTGKNIDILDLKIQFDATWFNSVNKYTKDKAGTNTTQATEKNAVGAGLGTLSSTLGFLAKFIPGLAGIPTATPMRFHNISGDQSNTIGMNIINRPGAQRAADVIKSIYSSSGGDMVSVDLTIVGDPTLIKQDDWSYSPSPKSSGGSSASAGTLSIDSIMGGDIPLSLPTISEASADFVGPPSSLADGGSAAATRLAGSAGGMLSGLLNGLGNSLMGSLLGGKGGYGDMSQSAFAKKYGHIKMDNGEVIATLTINTPLDIDADITNQGLVYPQPGTRTSFFSGQYKILTVDNRFSAGVFTQVLKMVRCNNSDTAKVGLGGLVERISAGLMSTVEAKAKELIKGAGGLIDSVEESLTNQLSDVSTNGDTDTLAASDIEGASETPGVVTYDDGSTLQTFDDGSTLATGTDGSISSSPSDDSGSLARSDNIIDNSRE